MGRFWK